MLLAVVGPVFVPIFLLVLGGSAQLEVAVVERSSDLLLHFSSPHIPAPATVADYNPYPPGMAVFGLPHAVFGDGLLTDARWWMAGTFFLATAAAVRTLVRRVRERSPTAGSGTVPHSTATAHLCCCGSRPARWWPCRWLSVGSTFR
ncbi:hypothetical protein ACO0M4_04080 [Streptomyces sp. RGM 3693]|uniref:hypothetical protein n=1 Tax=Streptomyces sp. RGM 3693 TaxID=3413284 RepID=UPI003D2DF856